MSRALGAVTRGVQTQAVSTLGRQTIRTRCIHNAYASDVSPAPAGTMGEKESEVLCLFVVLESGATGFMEPVSQ